MEQSVESCLLTFRAQRLAWIRMEFQPTSTTLHQSREKLEGGFTCDQSGRQLHDGANVKVV